MKSPLFLEKNLPTLSSAYGPGVKLCKLHIQTRRDFVDTESQLKACFKAYLYGNQAFFAFSYGTKEG